MGFSWKRFVASALMRVIGGSARGRQLTIFAGRDIRPTPDRVREALFSILYSRQGGFPAGKVLDLFAGSGALGIEALSRGAEHAWFIDSSRQAVEIVRQNLDRCKLTDQTTLLMCDVWKVLPAVAGSGPFDLVFADPPYGRDDAPRLLAEICRLDLLKPHGILCIETAATDPVPDRSGRLSRVDQRRYGSTTLHIFQPSIEDQG